MLKTIKKSSNKKLGGCAATYRSGLDNVYSTCPSSCPLKPEQFQGSEQVDQTYLLALSLAVPQDGVSWTYTHFPKENIPLPSSGRTCINISTDSIREALDSFLDGYPVVVVRPSSETEKVDVVDGIRMVRCPAEYSNATCDTCGTNTPLCARWNRDYIIKFTAHGSQSKTIKLREDNLNLKGGCYGNGGPVRLQWEKTKGTTENDAETLTRFVASLPPGTKLRHHVVGDIG